MSDSKSGQILGKDIAGVNCILPHKHKTAWDLFLKGCAYFRNIHFWDMFV